MSNNEFNPGKDYKYFTDGLEVRNMISDLANYLEFDLPNETDEDKKEQMIIVDYCISILQNIKNNISIS